MRSRQKIPKTNPSRLSCKFSPPKKSSSSTRSRGYTGICGIRLHDRVVMGVDSRMTTCDFSRVVQNNYNKLMPIGLRRRAFVAVSGNPNTIGDVVNHVRKLCTPNLPSTVGAIAEMFFTLINNSVPLHEGIEIALAGRIGNDRSRLFVIAKRPDDPICERPRQPGWFALGCGYRGFERQRREKLEELGTKSIPETENFIFRQLRRAQKLDWATGGDLKVLTVPNDGLARERHFWPTNYARCTSDHNASEL